MHVDEVLNVQILFRRLNGFDLKHLALHLRHKTKNTVNGSVERDFVGFFVCFNHSAFTLTIKVEGSGRDDSGSFGTTIAPISVYVLGQM